MTRREADASDSMIYGRLNAAQMSTADRRAALADMTAAFIFVDVLTRAARALSKMGRRLHGPALGQPAKRVRPEPR